MDATASRLPLPPQATALPPIAQLIPSTHHLPDNKDPPTLPYSSLPIRNPDPRDSGNWSQSKRKYWHPQLGHTSLSNPKDSSGVSNNGMPLHSLLNAEDSPSRNSVPDTPQSATVRPPPSLHVRECNIIIKHPLTFAA